MFQPGVPFGSPTFGPPLSGLSNLTATGNDLASAYLVWAGDSTFTDVPPGTGCRLPAPSNQPYTITNYSSNVLLVYPALGDQIAQLLPNQPISLAPGNSFTFSSFANALTPQPRQWNVTVGSSNTNASGNVLGPNSSVPGDVAMFSTNSGTVIADSGIAAARIVQGPTSATAGDVAVFGSGQTLVVDSGIPSARIVQGPTTAASGDIVMFGTAATLAVDSGISAAKIVQGVTSGFTISAAMQPVVTAATLGQSQQTYLGDATPLTLTGTMTTTGTGAVPWASLLFNSISPVTEFGITHPSPQGAFQPLVVGCAVPIGATITEMDTFYSYITNASTITGGVSFGANARSTGDGTHNWAMAAIVADGGHNDCQTITIEMDYGSSNTSTLCYGITALCDNLDGTPAEGSAYLSAAFTGGAPIGTSFTSFPGAAETALFAGPLASGASQSSQPIVLQGESTSSVTGLVQLQAQYSATTVDANLTVETGSIFLSPSSNEKVSVNSPIQLEQYSVADLPVPTAYFANTLAVVTDADVPAYGVEVAGGGSTKCFVFCDGGAWYPFAIDDQSNQTFGTNILPNADNAYTVGMSGARTSALWSANGTVQTSDPSLKTDVSPLPSVLDLIMSLDPITFKWIDGGASVEMQTKTVMAPVMESYAAQEAGVSVVGGKPTWVERAVQRQRLVFDVLPVLNQDGTPATVVKPAQKELRGRRGKLVRAATPATTVQRMHRVPRMAPKDVSVPTLVRHAGRRTHWGWDAAAVKAAFDKIGMDFGGFVKAEDGSLHLRPDQFAPVNWKGLQETVSIVREQDARLARQETAIAALTAEIAALKAAKT